MVRSLALAAVSLLSVPAAAAEWPDLSDPPRLSGKATGDAALVIAIEDYAFTADIPGAAQNGRDWVSFLDEAVGVGLVKPVFDSAATKETILEHAATVAGQVEPGGRMWLVFIGHGAPSPDTSDGLLIGADAQATASSLSARGVTRAELIDAIDSGLPADARAVLLLDACFSGTTGAGVELVPGLQPLSVVADRLETPRHTVLTAATSNQFAGPLAGESRPAFSYLMLGALHGWDDDDGRVSAYEAVKLANKAMYTTITDRTQTGTHFGPDLVLVEGARTKAPPFTELAMASTARKGPATSASGSNVDASVQDMADEIASLKQSQEQRLREERLRAEVDAAVRATLDGKATDLQQQAVQTWTDLQDMLDVGGPEAERAAMTFVQTYRDAEVWTKHPVSEDQVTRRVDVPQVRDAQRWLEKNTAAAKAAKAADRAEKRQRFDGLRKPGWVLAGSGAAVVAGTYAAYAGSSTMSSSAWATTQALNTIGWAVMGAGGAMVGVSLLDTGPGIHLRWTW